MDDCILVTNERIYQLCLIYFVFCSKNNNIKVFTPNIVCNGFLVLVQVFSNDEWFQKPYGWLYLGHKRKNMLSFVSEREFWVDNPVERCGWQPVMGETKILRSRPRPRLSFWVSWNRDRDRDFHFGFHGTETETETFILGLLEPRPRPRLWVWVSWNRDRDRDFYFGSRGIETETETFILGFMESRQRPRILFLVSRKIHGLLLPGVMEQKTKLKAPCIFASTNK